MSNTSQNQTVEDKVSSEAIITEQPPRARVEDEARIEQKKRELASCGMLRLDAPGATEEDHDGIEDLIAKLFSKGGLSDDEVRDAQPITEKNTSKSQRREIAEHLWNFTEEYKEAIIQALVEAMKRENWNGKTSDLFFPRDRWFSTLSEWDFTIPCGGCGQEIRSNALYVKPSRAKGDMKESFASKNCHNCGHSNDNIGRFGASEYGHGSFHWVAEQVLESLLVEACSNRYVAGTEYVVTLDGDREAPIWIQVSESGQMRKVKQGLSTDRYTKVQAREMADIIGLVHEANQNVPEGCEEVYITDHEGNRLLIRHSSRASDAGVFYARGMAVLEQLASRLRTLRKDEKGADDLRNDGSGETNLDRWAITMAAKILYEISKKEAGICVFNKPSNAMNENSSDGELDNHISDREEGWMIELSQEVTHFIDTNLDEELLRNFYNRETVPPMICKPVDWELDDKLLAKGGFITSPMQLRMPIVPREVTHLRLDQSRIRLTKESLKAINRAQHVEYHVNSDMLKVERNVMHKRVSDCVNESIILKRFEPEHTREQLESMKVDELRALLKQRNLPYSGLTSEELVTRLSTEYYFLEQNGERLLHPSSQSYIEWMKELNYAQGLLDDSIAQGRFFHPYRMDHRGRMYTASTILDPQGDDVSRGLIQFDSAIPLDEQGWKWLSIGVAKAWEGTDALGAPSKRSTFAQLLNASKNPEFIATLEGVVADPVGTMDIWGTPGGESDLMRSHAEGFQRMAVSKAFISALGQGGIGAQCRHVMVQDASSNIYQHNSLILLDKDMADKVNVTPADSGHSPRDAYSEIGRVVGGDEDFLDYMEIIGIDRDVAEKIRQTVSARAFAKSPVMVLGYGAGKDAISEKYLTHSGKSRREGGRVEWHHVMEDAEYFDNFESSLKEACNSVDSLGNINSEIIDSIPANASGEREYNRSWKRATKDLVRQALELDETTRLKLSKNDLDFLSANYEDSFETIENLFDSLTADPVRMCAHRESLLAGVLEDVSKELHLGVAMLTADAYVRAIREILPNYDRTKKELRSIVRNSGSFPFTWNPGMDGLEVIHLALKKPSYQRISRVDAQKQWGEGNLSRRKYSETRDHRAELMAIAPNFVHSIDAAHMRAVTVCLTDIQIEKNLPVQFWMVHDAFGSHPNFINDMRIIVRDKLQEIYNATTLNKVDLVKQANSVGKRISELRGYESLETSSIDEAAKIFHVDPQDWVFLNNPNISIRDRVRVALDHIGFEMEEHPALSEPELEEKHKGQRLTIKLLKEECKNRDLKVSAPKRGKGVHRKALLERLSVETIVIKPIPNSVIEAILADPEHEYNQRAKIAIDALRVLTNLDPLFSDADSIELENFFEKLYSLRSGKKLFNTDNRAKGIGTLDLNQLSSSEGTDEWYFLS